MLLTAALVPIGAYVALRAELDVLVQEHSRRGLEAFYVAESGLEHALADLAWDPAFARLRAGPDRQEETADDHLYPFREGPPQFFPVPPCRYRVEVEDIDASSVDVVSYGHATGSSLRAVAARVRRSPAPHVPAALFTADPQVVEVADDFVIEGAPEASGLDVPAIAAEDDPDVDLILSQLSAAARTHVRGPGGPPSVRPRGFQALSGLVTALARLAGAQPLPSSVHGGLGAGVFVAPQSVEVGDADGGGILVVDGDLRLTGHFAFAGLVLVGGDVRAEADSSMELSGALLQARPGRALLLEGEGRIVYDPRALEVADALAPGALPRRAIIGPWRERL